MTATEAPTLAEALAERGITYRRDEHSDRDGRMVLVDVHGRQIGRHDAPEAWALLRLQVAA